EGRLEQVMILPLREVRDEILADLVPEVFSASRIEALPILNGLEVDEPNREELSPFLLEFCPAGLTDLRLDPFAFQTSRREHQEQLVVDADRLIDLLMKLLAPVDVLGRVPDPQPLIAHLGVKSFGKLLILVAVADEARIE